MYAPPAPFLPSELQGAPVVTVLAAYWGDVDAPLKESRPPST